MTAVDFRDGGYDDRYGGGRHDGGHGQHHAGYDHGGWDDPARYSTDAESDVLAARDGLAARITRLLNYLGALVSVALMVGLLVWGYRLVTRDVSGVPVIRALQGEARVAPDDPGGKLTEGRGLAVNAVPAGEGAGKVKSVEMAPPPSGLTDEDVAMGQLGATSRAPGPLAEVAPAPEAAPVVAITDAEARRRAEEEATAAAARAEAAAQAQAVADVAALPATSEEPATDGPVDSVVTDLAGAPAQAEAITSALAEAAVPDAALPVAAPRPAPRPQDLRRTAAAEPAPEPAAAQETAPAVADKPADRPVEPAKVEAKAEAPAPAAAAGKTVVQIGAFDSDKLARGEWDRVAGRNGGLFSGKSQVVQKTQRNGRTFWRLRVAGFESRDEARAFCAKLKAAGTDCIPTAAN